MINRPSDREKELDQLVKDLAEELLTIKAYFKEINNRLKKLEKSEKKDEPKENN